MLQSNGIPAHAVEDQSGVSFSISQFHKPKIWVDQPTVAKAELLIRKFEEKNRKLFVHETAFLGSHKGTEDTKENEYQSQLRIIGG